MAGFPKRKPTRGAQFFQGARGRAWPSRSTRPVNKNTIKTDLEDCPSQGGPITIVEPLKYRDQHKRGADETELRLVTIFTDGACVRNPGPGGYGVVQIQNGPGLQRRELFGGCRRTTNNRMEILAVIKGLEALKRRCRVQVYSDSTYVVNAISRGWAKRWRAKNWMRNASERRPNADLWEKLLELCEQHEVTAQWVKGHSGNKENERCDYLAETAARMTGLPPDPGYSS